MQKGAGLLSGTLDFRSFCASGSAVKHFVRTIEKNERVQGLGFVFQLVILMAAYLRYRVKKSLEQEGTPLVTPQKQKLDHPTVRVILDMLAELMVIRSGH